MKINNQKILIVILILLCLTMQGIIFVFKPEIENPFSKLPNLTSNDYDNKINKIFNELLNKNPDSQISVFLQFNDTMKKTEIDEKFALYNLEIEIYSGEGMYLRTETITPKNDNYDKYMNVDFDEIKIKASIRDIEALRKDNRQIKRIIIDWEDIYFADLLNYNFLTSL